ncbi:MULTISPECIES: tetratricopeptide repeat protein [Flavobacterium]|uniref:Tetratricopeptide repeat protein n=1 Tax=Flavobacterium gawalongense TaxID=2594432 RepID=A0A553BLG9_9FLAO|nr:tetratricopeptide repeat protein [Flavobacterium gawalongense]TRX00822.1 tetratricopeptide repeat protein [Flavobacterium gawalongense]TRX05122.1 tetratricopeptide repeat protein [Flavobacterium gawalongense]TRX09098.1 tetratricopeptide repeat protein [Flavobacterium gawalongense]TRX10233.1 tetratricopeptide repeat protein [Flavobacterium gawalongense]TRX27099.1 tetratricopeptide repeat protein [Flavobacterium gawalongense]
MKSKYVILASALLISVATFAQKDQIKAAEKALKGGNSQEAATILQGAESLITNATDAEKAQFFFVKGNALLDLANKNVDTNTNLSLAAKAYQDLIAVEQTSGKVKYSTQAATSITQIKFKLINSAIADSKIEKHSDSAKKLYDAYLLDKKDTLNLYYAASTYVNAKEYDSALKLYEELKNLNYSGKGTSYFAVNKLSSEEDVFATAQERDRMVKLGTHEKPRTEAIPSKRGEIYKNMALILVQNGKTEEAKKAIAEARVANPDDTSLILTEANLYLETKDFDTYKKLISEVLEKNPNDADLVFNLGVISTTANNTVEAEKYYKRAIEIKPDYVNAYLNLAILKLDADKKLFEEMNKLGNSEKDNKRYLVLKKQREAVFMDALPYLEKASELDPSNNEVKATLLNVYGALEMTEKKKALKAKM